MHKIEQENIQKFKNYLVEQERSAATIEKYGHALERFVQYLPAGSGVDKVSVIQYKELLAQHFAPASVNTTLAALNGFFRFFGWVDCVVKPLHIQRRVFASSDKELTREEYKRLVAAAQQKSDTRLALLLQLMASTGIRVSEVPYVTAEAVAEKVIRIRLKGKIRTILLPDKLCSRLKQYQKEKRITTGPLFLTRTGHVMSRKEVWAQMKRLCRSAGVPDSKVFPHNLRHLFARSFYAEQQDIVKLADLLRHSNIETTRIYLLSSGQEHRQILERLCLIC